MRIGVTGAHGLIGWHTLCFLHVTDQVTPIGASRADFASPNALDDFVNKCDAIIHFAGQNRGDDELVERVNQQLAEQLVESLERVGQTPHLVFASSTHIDRDTAYGRSKRAAAKIFNDWSERCGAMFTNLILPHVFGEFGRPFYNSVVSTFCHQLALGEEPCIELDGQLELLHAHEVAEIALATIVNAQEGDVRPEGRVLQVSEMLGMITSMADRYRQGVIPGFNDPFELRLFNVFRSYLYPDYYPQSITLHRDQRGALFESVKSDHGGQAFLSTTKVGVTRGDHFHFNKVERFLVINGQAEIRIRRLLTDQVTVFKVGGEQPVYIDIPTLHTHNITNIGDSDLLTFFWSHEIFDPVNSDTYAEPVIPVEEEGRA